MKTVETAPETPASDYVSEVVAQAPALRPEQVEKLTALLRPVTPPGGDQ